MTPYRLAALGMWNPPDILVECASEALMATLDATAFGLWLQRPDAVQRVPVARHMVIRAHAGLWPMASLTGRADYEALLAEPIAWGAGYIGQSGTPTGRAGDKACEAWGHVATLARAGKPIARALASATLASARCGWIALTLPAPLSMPAAP